MNKRNFFTTVGGLMGFAALPAFATERMETKNELSQHDPIWFTIWGTVFEIHQHHRTWHAWGEVFGDPTPQELEAANISVSGLLATKVGSKFQEEKCIAGFKRDQIGTTAKQYIEVGTEPCTQGVRGFLYRVQAPIEERGMVEIQSVYVTSQNPGQMIKETPLVVASIGFDKYLLSCDNSEYQLYQWKRYQGS